MEKRVYREGAKVAKVRREESGKLKREERDGQELFATCPDRGPPGGGFNAESGNLKEEFTAEALREAKRKAES